MPWLRALVHNAGVLPPERTVTDDGHGLTLATHVLGPHVLTDALRGPLAADGAGRVLFVASGGMYAQRLYDDDPEYTLGDYPAPPPTPAPSGCRSTSPRSGPGCSSPRGPRCTACTRAGRPPRGRRLAARLRQGDGAAAPHAGAGGGTAVWLLAAREAHETTGLFWHDRRPRPTSYSPGRGLPEHVRALWNFCVRTTGVPA